MIRLFSNINFFLLSMSNFKSFFQIIVINRRKSERREQLLVTLGVLFMWFSITP